MQDQMIQILEAQIDRLTKQLSSLDNQVLEKYELLQKIDRDLALSYMNMSSMRQMHINEKVKLATQLNDLLDPPKKPDFADRMLEVCSNPTAQILITKLLEEASKEDKEPGDELDWNILFTDDFEKKCDKLIVLYNKFAPILKLDE